MVLPILFKEVSMKHDNARPDNVQGPHKYVPGVGYVEDKDFVPSEYPRYEGDKIVYGPPKEDEDGSGESA